MSTEKNQKNVGLDLLEVKKSPKADLESMRTLWVLIGLVASLVAFYGFIEWTAFEDKEKPLAVRQDKDVEEPIIMIEIPVTLPEKKVVPPPPEAKEIVDIIEIVEEEDMDDVEESELISTDVMSEWADYTDTETVVVEQEVVEEEVFQVVEVQPEFPGGTAALMKYLRDNINYPRISRENNSQGRAIIRFVVNSDGSIQDVEVFKSTGDIYLDKEAVRVVEAMPKWSPGKQSGKPVRVYFTLPVSFRLQ